MFDQQYFVCDYWFNVDCSQAESFYFLNDEIAAERESNIGAVAPESGIGVTLGRGGQGLGAGNSFNGRGSKGGSVGGSSSNGRGGSQGNSGGDNIQTLYGAPRPGRDVIDGRNTEYKDIQDEIKEDLEYDIDSVIGLTENDY